MPEIIPNPHPLFVHFPIALISLSAFFHVVALATRRKRCAIHCATVAHTTLWLGALAALPTAIFGGLAFNSVNHDEAGHAAMLIHRAWALATVAMLAVLASWDVWRSKVDTPPTVWFTAAVIGAWGMIATTAWYGGELVYRHGLGVISLPIAEAGHEHGHAHDAMPDGEEHTHADAMPADGAHEHSPDGHAH